EAIVNIQSAISAAWNAASIPEALAQVGIVTANTSKIISTISGTNLQGMAHDGMNYIPEDGTWLLQKGERVIDSRTNADLKEYLSSNRGGGGDITINNHFTVGQGATEEDAQM